MDNEADWTPPHRHDPNPSPPTADPSFVLLTTRSVIRITPNDLLGLPHASVPDCYIVSTGHGTSGPFAFAGVPLLYFLDRYLGGDWTAAEIAGADGFRTRMASGELRAATKRPVLLALARDGRPLSRAQGLVRLIVPGEVGDALRQVKWVGEIRAIGHAQR